MENLILQIFRRFNSTYHEVLSTIIEFFQRQENIGFMELVKLIGKNKGYISKILSQLEKWNLIFREGNRPQRIIPNINLLGNI